MTDKGDDSRELPDYLHQKKSDSYLGMDELKNNYAYVIVARNADVGIWLADERGFLIARYKIKPDPYLFVEFHWDTGEPHGTAKPQHEIEPCPFQAIRTPSRPHDLLNYLVNLDKRCSMSFMTEAANRRSESAIKFAERLRRKRPETHVPIHVTKKL